LMTPEICFHFSER